MARPAATWKPVQFEHPQQADQPGELGCEQGQVYLLSRPLSVEATEDLLDRIGEHGYVIESAVPSARG